MNSLNNATIRTKEARPDLAMVNEEFSSHSVIIAHTKANTVRVLYATEGQIEEINGKLDGKIEEIRPTTTQIKDGIVHIKMEWEGGPNAGTEEVVSHRRPQLIKDLHTGEAA